MGTVIFSPNFLGNELTTGYISTGTFTTFLWPPLGNSRIWWMESVKQPVALPADEDSVHWICLGNASNCTQRDLRHFVLFDRRQTCLAYLFYFINRHISSQIFLHAFLGMFVSGLLYLSLPTARTNISWSFWNTIMEQLYTLTKIRTKTSSFSQNIFMLNIFINSALDSFALLISYSLNVLINRKRLFVSLSFLSLYPFSFFPSLITFTLWLPFSWIFSSCFNFCSRSRSGCLLAGSFLTSCFNFCSRSRSGCLLAGSFLTSCFNFCSRSRSGCLLAGSFLTSCFYFCSRSLSGCLLARSFQTSCFNFLLCSLNAASCLILCFSFCSRSRSDCF